MKTVEKVSKKIDDFIRRTGISLSNEEYSTLAGFIDIDIELHDDSEMLMSEDLCGCADLNATNRICNHCGKVVPIRHYASEPKEPSDAKRIEHLFKKYKKEKMPNANIPFHYEAEIAAGFTHFIEWLSAPEQEEGGEDE